MRADLLHPFVSCPDGSGRQHIVRDTGAPYRSLCGRSIPIARGLLAPRLDAPDDSVCQRCWSFYARDMALPGSRLRLGAKGPLEGPRAV
jgi:hypothetical protein